MHHLFFFKQGMMNLGLAVVLATLAASTGCFLIHKLRAENEPFSGHQIFYGFGFGVALISWAMLMLAAFGALNRWTLGALIIAQAGVVIVTRGKILQVLGASLKNLGLEYYTLWKHSSGKLALIGLSILILGILGGGGLISFVPTQEVDGISSYLSATRLFWLYGGLIDVGHVVGNMAKQGFMPLLYGYALSSSILSQIWVLLIAYMAMLHMHAHFSRHISLIAATVTMMVLMTMSQQVDYTFGIVKVDGQSLAFSLLALISWHDYTQSKSRVHLIINAVAAGFLVGVSYMNLLGSVVFFGLMLVAIFKTEEDRKQRIRLLGLWSAIGFVIAAPSYLYNWITFGNPIYPYLPEIFGHGLGDPLLDNRGFVHLMLQMLQHDLNVRDFWGLLTLPYTIWQKPHIFQTRGDQVFLIFWVFSMVGALFLMLRPDKKAPRFMTVPLGIGYVLLYLGWATRQYILRYFTLGFPIIFWFGAQTIERIVPILKRFWLVNVALLAFGYYMYGYMHITISLTLDMIKIMREEESLEKYLSRTFTYESSDGKSRLKFGASIADFRGRFKPGDKVLSFVPGNFYFGDKVIVFNANGTLSMPSPLGLPKPLYLYPNAKALMADLKTSQFDYIVIHPEFLFLTKHEKPVVEDLLKKVKPLVVVEGMRLIKVAR